ncbi:DDE-type integrase/transposase/recombinase [Streptomyces sp. NBC_00481]|uniref:DDE-type integrase/transposase/recombinase n=1 Tax=unclassified Streptomyces TaxID=2593676 RepID=UPI003FA35879
MRPQPQPAPGAHAQIDTGEGKLYLATVIDLFSRRLLGYAMGVRHDAELVVASLNMAAATRGGNVSPAQTRPGSSAVKSRRTKSGAAARFPGRVRPGAFGSSVRPGRVRP